MGLMKILRHKRINEAQLGVFAELVHVVFHIVGELFRGHIETWGVIADSVMDWGSAFSRVVSASAPGGAAVCCFLATISGAVSRYLAVEALVVLLEFLFLGFGVLGSSATGRIHIHVVSSLRGRAVVWFGWFLVV